jgi:hypothetical protein
MTSARRVASATSSYPLMEGRSWHWRYLPRLVVSSGGSEVAVHSVNFALPDFGKSAMKAAWMLTASAAGGKKIPSSPYPRVGYQSALTKSLKSLGGFTFSQGQGRIGLVPFNLTPRRTPRVERLRLSHISSPQLYRGSAASRHRDHLCWDASRSRGYVSARPSRKIRQNTSPLLRGLTAAGGSL